MESYTQKYRELSDDELGQLKTIYTQSVLCRELNEAAPEFWYERIGAIVIEQYRREIINGTSTHQ